tara:strand:- start:4723 stop:6093 length:1371 start_codon:yes stop_codon:yes gene_type:complete
MKPFKKSNKLGDSQGFGGYEEGPDLTPTGGDYDPAQGDKLKRKQQLENLLSGNPNTFIDEKLDSSITTGGQDPANIRQLGPTGDMDAVVFEKEQSKMISSMESDLDVLKKTAANIPDADLDLDMGAIDTERFDRAARQQKLAKKLNKPVKKIEVTKTPDEFKGFTVRGYFEDKIAELEGRIAIEKAVMGESYEAQERSANIEQKTKSIGMDIVDRELALSDEAMKKRPSKGAMSNISNVAGEDITRMRQDIAAPLNQVSKGVGETADIEKGIGTKPAFVNEIKNQPVYDINNQPTGESRYDKITRLGGGPRTKKTAEMIEQLRSRSQVQLTSPITGLEPPDTPPAKPPASTGATDRTRAKFKSKYGGGNVARGSKNVKATDLPSSVLEQSDEYKKVYGNAISKGLDDVTAAAIAMKATKAAKGLFKKNPALMPITEFFSPLKKALDDIDKKPDYTK